MQDRADNETRQSVQDLFTRRLNAPNRTKVSCLVHSSLPLNFKPVPFLNSCNSTDDFLKITDCVESNVLCDTPNYSRLLTTSASNSLMIEYSSTRLGFTSPFQRGFKIYVESIKDSSLQPHLLIFFAFCSNRRSTVVSRIHVAQANHFRSCICW
jgi:hypothetical protein